MRKLTRLFIATINGNVTEIDRLLDAGCDINGMDEVSGTPLLEAIRSGKLRGIKHLIERGADVDLRGPYGLTPLNAACSKGGTKGREVVFMLVEYGCNLLYRNEHGISALEIAVRKSLPEVVKLLLEKGLPVNGTRKCLSTPAILAAGDGQLENLKVLIRYGADLTLTDRRRPNYGMTCLDWAIYEKHWKVMRYLRSLGSKVAPESEEARSMARNFSTDSQTAKKKVAKKKVAK